MTKYKRYAKPSVTQKHFDYTANKIADMRSLFPDANPAFDEIVEGLIVIFAQANPRFKPELFRSKCR